MTGDPEHLIREAERFLFETDSVARLRSDAACVGRRFGHDGHTTSGHREAFNGRAGRDIPESD
jgi:hypothetical protein